MEKYDIGNRIYELRKEQNISQKELGEMLGVSNKSVSKWETGSAIPKTETLVKLAEVFGVSSEELLLGKTDDKRTLGKLSLEANQHFLREELDQRNNMDNQKEVQLRKKYLAILLTLFAISFVILTAFGSSGIFETESYKIVLTTFWSAYGICSLFTALMLMIKIVKGLNIVRTIIFCLLLPFSITMFWIVGIVLVIPSIVKSIKIIKDDKNGHKQN